VLTIAMADIYLDYSRARKDFGYEPPYTMEDAFAQCSQYYQPEIASNQKQQ
jgi:nucleoside-diphosphate-sugar epimerase